MSIIGHGNSWDEDTIARKPPKPQLSHGSPSLKDKYHAGMKVEFFYNQTKWHPCTVIAVPSPKSVV